MSEQRGGGQFGQTGSGGRTGRGSYGQGRSSGQGRRPRAEANPDEDESQTVIRGGTITKITAQVRDPKRSSVFLDGEFAFGISTDRVLERGLAPKDVLTAERVAELITLDTVDWAIASGMDLLSYRPRSTQEIRDRLARKGFTEPAVEAAIERLAGWGYLNDSDFARRWVENRTEHRPRGTRLLAQELRHKGIDRELIGETLDEADIDELAAALRAGERKAQSYAKLDPAIARRRLSGFLARRGFNGGTVRQATEQLLDEQFDVADGENSDSDE